MILVLHPNKNRQRKQKQQNPSFLPSNTFVLSLACMHGASPSLHLALLHFQNCLFGISSCKTLLLSTFNATPAEATEHSEWKINQTGARDADRINLWHLPLWKLHLSTERLCVFMLEFSTASTSIFHALAPEYLHSICLTGWGQS